MRGVLIDGFDPERAWRRAPSVALRPEPFGALAYSFTTRRLTFLKSAVLVAVVESLADHPSATAALAAFGVADAERPAYLRALGELAGSAMIERRPPVEST